MARMRNDALPEGYEFEGYRIERVLGAGGFGITYLATDSEFGRAVALKEYLPSGFAGRVDGTTVRPLGPNMREDFEWGLASFREEGATLAGFHHQNIVTVFRLFEAHRTAYLAMRYVEGESLEELLGRRPLGETEIRAILDPLLDGLEQVHEAGFLHRDIKPANIVLGKKGEPVLIDFGAARQALGDRTMTHTAIVSTGYSPPEQYGSRGRRGPATDIYALAATLYRCVTGRRPPDATDRLLGDAPLEPAAKLGAGRYSRELLNAIDAGLVLDADKRPQSVEAFRALVRRTAGRGTPGAEAGRAREQEPKPKPKPKTAPKPRHAATPWTAANGGSGSSPQAAGASGAALPRRWALGGVGALAACAVAMAVALDIAETSAPRGEFAGFLREIGLPVEKHPIGRVFRDCPECPEMVAIPTGDYRYNFVAGKNGNQGMFVRIGERLAFGRHEVTFDQWDACVEDGGCRGFRPEDERDWGRGRRPVVNVNWEDASAYADWLSRTTGHRYRLPSDTEWEYAARAGTTTLWYWGDEVGEGNANCDGCGSFWDGEATAPVGAFEPNRFGLHDMAGNVWEWTLDCTKTDEGDRDQPRDGTAFTGGDCSRRVLRGGSWYHGPDYAWSARPLVANAEARDVIVGFRVVREISE